MRHLMNSYNHFLPRSIIIPVNTSVAFPWQWLVTYFALKKYKRIYTQELNFNGEAGKVIGVSIG